jgi:amino acid adenylation domain-containing protein/non-ribosomal peptide synthase protein (TIGR01720 family)
MNIDPIHEFIYTLSNKNIKIWANNDKVNLFVPDGVDFTDEDKYFIKNNKDSILHCLLSHEITSRELSWLILKNSSNKQRLSFAQERLWFIEKYEEGSNAYNIPLTFKIAKNCNLCVLEKSILNIVARHEILRTVIKVDENGQAQQEVLNLDTHPLKIHRSVVDNIVELKTILKLSANYIYDLSQEFPIRVSICEVNGPTEEVTYYVSIVVHHIAFDGWSIDLFLKELALFYSYYTAEHNGIKCELNIPALPLQYKDFAIWQRQYLTEKLLERQIEYWQAKLKSYVPLNLITDKVRPLQFDYRGQDLFFDIDINTSRGLRELAKILGISLYSVLLAGFYLMLKAYSNQDDIVIGMSVANRHYSQIENLIGFFVNAVVLRQKMDGNAKLKDFIQQVGMDVKAAQLHQDLPFEKLVEELNVTKDTSRHPIFQVMFGMNNLTEEIGDEKETKLLADIFEDYNHEQEIYNVSKFDLSGFVDASAEKLKCSFNYASSLFNAGTIEGFTHTYITILRQFSKLAFDKVAQQKMLVQELNYLSIEADRQIIFPCNATEMDYPKDKTIQKLFEEQVGRTPDKVAVVYEDLNLTYKELNERANRLANYLIQNHKVTPDTLVALCLDRSEHMLIAILGVLKSGGAYVPIDPGYPLDRIEYVFADTKTCVTITNKIYQDRLESISSAISSKIICIDDDGFQKELAFINTSNPSTVTTSNNLAYVIYTSGTTGRPKGVMMGHQGVVNRIVWMNKEYPLHDNDVILNKTDYTFDVSVWELIWANLYGSTTVLAGDKLHKDIFYLAAIIKKRLISIIHFVPSALSAFIEGISETTNTFGSVHFLQKIFCSGEELKLKQVENLHKLLPATMVHNLYGPTEAAIDVLYYDCSFKDLERIYIGKPISNIKVHILSKELQPVPPNAIGELYIGGIGLARGYLNRPDLTAERFIANPFQTIQECLENTNGRLYRTGDLVRYTTDGNIEFIGRNDFQVKIRGFRIELGEIEAALASYPEIKQSVVLARENKLVGYYVAETKLNNEQIYTYLEKILPEYMIPSNLMYLETMPLAINGKLNREALPAPEFINLDTYVGPRNDLENSVRRIWAKVLNLDEAKVGISDDFFRLGGDSIVSIQLVSRLRQTLGLNVSVKDIFSYKTIDRLYDNVISNSITNNAKLISEQGLLSGALGLLPIQKWFFDNEYAAINHYNQAFTIKTAALDIEKLKTSLVKLIERHDAFRLRFKKSQYYANDAQIQELRILDVNELKNAELQDILTLWQSDFNIEVGPVYGIAYLHGYADGSARVWFALHHLLIDSVSWRIIAEDLREIYEGNDLGAKGSSYRQWVSAIDSYALNNTKEQSYWLNVLSDYNAEFLAGKVDCANAINYSAVELDLTQTELLLTKVNGIYNTQINDVLITAFSYALQEIIGQTVSHITMEGHGREEIDPSLDINRTVGWFTSMYPIRIELQNELGKSLKYVKETLRQVPNKGIGYGAIFGYKNDALPGICFNYLGQFDTKETVDSWNIVAENSGRAISLENHNLSLISVNGLTTNGKLHFNIASKLDEVSTKHLAQVFIDRLIDLINHTTNKSRTYLTASDIDGIINQEYLDKLQINTEIEGVYLANSLQQGFVYHALNQGDIDDAYLVQNIWEYNSPIDVDKLKQAWGYAQQRYPSLRLRFGWEAEIVQVIDKDGTLDWRYIDLSNSIVDSQQQAHRIALIRQLDRQERYNLDFGGLFRVYIIKQSKNLYTCIFSSHHAILDGWSNPLLIGYVHKVYLNLLFGKPIAAVKDYTYIETQKYSQKNRFAHQAYWHKYIGQLEDRCDFSGLMQDSTKNIKLAEYKHIKNPQEQRLIIDGDLYDKIKALGQEQGVTLNAILQYILHKVLSIYGNSKHTVVGATVSGRNLPIDDIESSVGLYINTLPLIVDHEAQENMRIIEAIRKLQDNINEINTRSVVELATLQKGGGRLFDVLCVYENYPTNVISEEQDSTLVIKFTGGVEKLDYPLHFKASESNGKLSCVVGYAGELFNKTAMEQLLLTARMLLEQVASNPQQTVRDLSSISADQYQQTIYTWNATDNDYPHDKTIQQLFEEQAARTPDRIAIVYEDISLTYKELNERANRLANYLIQNHKVTSDTLVALCLDRSEYMLIAILGVLKSGGAYVPVDPNYPDERLDYVLTDTAAKVVLTNSIYADRLKQLALSTTARTILNIDSEELQSELLQNRSNNPKTTTVSENLAYVIYTSGTTGKPKGVMIEHLPFVITINALKNRYFLTCEEINTYSMTSYVFDIFGLEYAMPLLNGGSITIGKNTFEALDCSNFNFIQITPSLCSLKLEAFKNTSHLKLLIGGENLSFELLQKVLSKSIDVVNVYGPTETTIWSSAMEYFNQEHADSLFVSLGTSLSNEKSYVLNPELTPVPVGAIGELYIGGAGLSRGYLNQPGLTADKFRANPFQTAEDKRLNKNSRLFKTGDLVRYLPNGNLQYIGRNDFQVKIRGFRIELWEIESILNGFSGIKQSVVLALERTNAKDDKYLVAYYVAADKLDTELMYAFLEQQLPEYMIPRSFVYLTALPLNVNGKLDRKALPAPAFADEDNYVEPRNALENSMRAIWAELLHLDETKIGIRDDFFKVGGDSIVSVKLVNRLRQVLGLNLSVRDIFSDKTIEKMCDKVTSASIINNDFVPFIRIDNQKHKNLFIFPPGRGGAESYLNNIALKIQDQNLILFNNYFLYLDGKLPDEKINGICFEQLAKQYIGYMQSIQAEGPYNLFGWSFGGVLAFEIARQLTAHNMKVDNLILVDSFFNFAKGFPDKNIGLSSEAQINYVYLPDVKVDISSFNVTLFKACAVPEVENNDMFVYYSQNTTYNHLDDYISKDRINLIKLNSDHNNWFNDKSDLDNITQAAAL